MKFIVLMIALLFCAGNLVGFYEQKDEREEDFLPFGFIDYAIYSSNENMKKSKPKAKRTFEKLLVSAIMVSSAILALGCLYSAERSSKLKTLLQTDSPKELLQNKLNPGWELNNLFDSGLNKTTSKCIASSFFECHRYLGSCRTYTVFPAHLQKLFQEERDTNHANAKSDSLNLMRHEWARYASFKTFPERSPAMPSRLAAAGFYYSGPADKVQCFSCKLVHGDWKVTDIPLEVHRRLSPNCKFISDNGDGNLSIHDDNKDLSDNIQTHAHCTLGETLSPNMNSNEDFESCESRADLDETDLTAHCKHPQYKELAVRQSSFSRWPCWDVQDPRKLAEAGFFYAGFSDCVRCFSCGIGLRNWEHGDGPLSEHARWSVDCLYLRKKLNGHSIDHFRGDDFDIPPSVSETISTPSAMKPATSEIAYSCITRELRGPDTSEKSNGKDLMGDVLDVTNKATEMGFDKHIVETALRKYQSGDFPRRGDAITCEKLLDMILEIENSGNPISPVSSRPDLTETVGSATQENATNSFLDKLPPKSDDKLSISHYDNALSIDCLRDENRRLKEQLVCKICMDKEANMILLPCGHMISCETCAPELRKCPICRQLVKKRIKAYLA